MQTILKYLIRFLAVIFVLTPHEYAHAYVAYKNGDPTAKMMGRMSLNPVKHLDPAGFVMCALVGFGWAKPVPINPGNFKNYKKGMFTTAIAGITVNYIIAFFAYLIYVLLYRFALLSTLPTAIYWIVYIIDSLCLVVFTYSLCSVVFNLLPLYPLDGFRVVEAFTRQINPVRQFLRQYGSVILICLVVESFLCDMLSPYVGWIDNFNILNYVMTFATNIIGFPIKAAWGWILNI
jgi:Zn-dependent protease